MKHKYNILLLIILISRGMEAGPINFIRNLGKFGGIFTLGYTGWHTYNFAKFQQEHNARIAEMIEDMNLQPVPDNSPLKSILQEALQLKGLQKENIVFLRNNKRNQGGASFSSFNCNYVILPSSFSIENDNVLKAIIDHELTHIKNRHSIIAQAFVNYAARSLPSPIAHFIVELSIKKRYHLQMHEIAADEGIRDDIKVLTAIANYFHQKYFENQFYYDVVYPYTRKNLNTIGYHLTTHPSPLERAKRFEERIQKLKKEEHR